jgi:hypothetical protein
MSDRRQKFATQVDETLLADLRTLAASEGRQVQHLVDEAISDLLEKKKGSRARPHVMATFGQSHERFGSLYEKLAK